MSVMDRDINVHKAHCYQGEDNASNCKYGSSNCPAKPKSKGRFHKQCPLEPRCIIDLKNGKELHRMMHEKISMFDVNFQHLYRANGFKISQELIEPFDLQKVAQLPQMQHACMDFGYWCPDQIKEQRLRVYYRSGDGILKEFKLTE